MALIGNILGFSAFGALLKLAGHRHHAPTPVAAVNYLLAAVICGIVSRSDTSGYGLAPVLAIGGAAGVAYVVGFYIYFGAIERAGLSIAQPTASMSLAIPVLASIAVWGEMPTLLQVVAIGAVGAALVLVGSGAGTAANGGAVSCVAGVGNRRGNAVALLVGLFFVQGATLVAPKVLEETGNWAYLWPYLTVLFSTASVGACLRWVTGRDMVALPGVGIGMALGVANVVATALLSVALAALPAIVVYPLASLGPMLISMALGVLVWHERPSRRALAGALIAIPAVVLLSL